PRLTISRRASSMLGFGLCLWQHNVGSQIPPHVCCRTVQRMGSTSSWRSYPSEKLRKLQLSSKWHIDDEDRAAVLFRPATGFLTEKFAETIVNWVIAVKPDIRKLVKATLPRS